MAELEHYINPRRLILKPIFLIKKIALKSYLTRPDIVESIHRQYLDKGADCIETNSFGANKVVLNEFDLIDKVYEINLKAAKIARKLRMNIQQRSSLALSLALMSRTKLPSLGQVTYDELVDSYGAGAWIIRWSC